MIFGNRFLSLRVRACFFTSLLAVLFTLARGQGIRLLTAPPLEQERVRLEANADVMRDAARIEIIRGFETSAMLSTDKITQTHRALVFSASNPLERTWFLFRIQGVKGQIVRIDFRNPTGTLDKWETFNPVFSYVADLADLNSFAATDPRQPGALQMAWNGTRPALPDTSGQKWHYIPNVWRVNDSTMACVMKFEQDSAFVAMRVPYPPSYNERYFEKISSNPLVKVIKIGEASRNGLSLLMARIGTGDDHEALKQKPCVLIYAGEHADNFDSMWTAQGVIEYLIGDSEDAKRLRDRFTFLVIPPLDPVRSFSAVPSGIASGFKPGRIRTVRGATEHIDYANWFQQWVNDGNRLDLVFNLHNVQSAESGHVACALMEELGQRGALSSRLHGLVVEEVRAAGLSAAASSQFGGWSPDRLGGWLSCYFGPLCLAYQLNSQAPDRHLTLSEQKGLSRHFLAALDQVFSSDAGTSLLRNVDARRDMRRRAWALNGVKAAGLNAIDGEAMVLGSPETMAESGMVPNENRVGEVSANPRIVAAPRPAPVVRPATRPILDTSGLRISANEAVKRTLAQIGLKDHDPAQITTSVEILPPDAVPFIGNELAGKKTWAVELTGIKLPTKQQNGINPHVRNLKVLLAPDSGQILSVTSNWPADLPQDKPPLTTTYIAERLERRTESYDSLPGEAPAVTLVEALTDQRGLFWMVGTKQVVVYHMNVRGFHINDRPCWVIFVRGTRGPYGTDQWREIVDVQTGARLGAGNF